MKITAALSTNSVSVVPGVLVGGATSLLVQHGNKLLLVAVDGFHHLRVGLAEAEKEGLQQVWLLEN